MALSRKFFVEVKKREFKIKKARTSLAMPIRQSETWVGGENVPDIYIIDPACQNL